MFYRLPPVGNKIRTEIAPPNNVVDAFSPHSIFFFNSGAASLAAAVRAVVDEANCLNPEVIVPAYTCPEVISAVLFANAQPVLVDLEKDRPWMDLSQVRRKLTNNTVAIIAVNLLGIQERISSLYKIIGQRHVRIIEDSAQSFPVSFEAQHYQGDLAIHSFGRGKPVSVLGGGAVICRRPELKESLTAIHQSVAMQSRRTFETWLKIKLYNLLISPRCYWLPELLPFLNLGQTVFHPLEGIFQMADYNVKLLSSNIDEYQQRRAEVQGELAGLAAGFRHHGVIDLLVAAGGCHDDVRLLRYPLLFPSAEIRDGVYNMLSRKGLGASRLYPCSLPNVDGLQDLLSSQGSFENAESFAQRLLTLPTHEGVNGRLVRAMAAACECVLFEYEDQSDA